MKTKFIFSSFLFLKLVLFSTPSYRRKESLVCSILITLGFFIVLASAHQVMIYSSKSQSSMVRCCSCQYRVHTISGNDMYVTSCHKYRLPRRSLMSAGRQCSLVRFSQQLQVRRQEIYSKYKSQDIYCKCRTIM